MYRDYNVLAQEFQSLQAVYPLAPRYVPRPMHLGEADGFGMLWMEGVPGTSHPARPPVSSIHDGRVGGYACIHSPRRQQRHGTNLSRTGMHAW